MGFRYRKSINLGGGFRINLSKSGIGYSWGTKGYRVTKTARGTTRRTYSIPGTGLSYVDETGSRSRKSNNRNNNSRQNQSQQCSRTQNRQPAQDTYRQNNIAMERAIQSADIEQFKEAEEGNITDAIERTLRLNWFGTILLICVILAAFNPAFVLLPIAGIVLKIAARSFGWVKGVSSLSTK